MTVCRRLAAVVTMLFLVACSSPKPAQPETQPIEDSPSAPAPSSATAAGSGPYAVGQKFTLAWKEGEATDKPDDVNVTVTVTKFDCGATANGLFNAGKAYYRESYGQSSDAKVDAGYALCVANLKIANTGKKRLQHDPLVQALDEGGVEYGLDDELTRLIADPITHANRESFGGATVSMNPRETAVSAVAFQIPSDTKITQLRYVGGGSVYSEPSTAIVQVS